MNETTWGVHGEVGINLSHLKTMSGEEIGGEVEERTRK